MAMVTGHDRAGHDTTSPRRVKPAVARRVRRPGASQEVRSRNQARKSGPGECLALAAALAHQQEQHDGAVEDIEQKAIQEGELV